MADDDVRSVKRPKHDHVPQNRQDDESAFGHMPSPAGEENVLDTAKDVGLYPDADESHQPEVDIAGQIRRNEQRRHRK